MQRLTLSSVSALLALEEVLELAHQLSGKIALDLGPRDGHDVLFLLPPLAQRVVDLLLRRHVGDADDLDGIVQPQLRDDFPHHPLGGGEDH